MSDPTPRQKRKVLLIGWDAADWKVIMPLVDEGKMPNLARFLEEGVCGNLATLQPVLSPMLWTSIATGKRAYKHGIHGFSEPDPVSGGVRPVTNLSRKTKAVWNILNQTNHKTVTIGWWPSNPVEELSRGVMVSNDYQRAPGNDPDKWPMMAGTVHPKKLEQPLKDLRVHPSTLTEEEIRYFLPGLEGMSREELDKVEKDPRIRSLAKIIADCTTIHSAASLLMNAPYDFMAVYYDAIDHFGHAFMKYHPPKRDHIDDWDYRVFHHCLEAGYCYHDQMLGDLLKSAGKETTVILMSDHGFHPDHLRPTHIPREPAGPAVEHRQFGIFAAKGPGIRKDDRIYGANMLDICPTLLHLFGLPVGEDMDGKVLLDIYEEPPEEIQRIPSWDEVEGDHGMHPPDRQISPADSKAALEQLVALGYIEKPDEDQEKALEQTVRELDYNLSIACLDGGLYNEAVVILERLYDKWPGEHRFGFNLATGYQKQNRAVELRELVTTIIERRITEANDAAEELKALNLDSEEKRAEENARIEKMNPRQKRKFFRERELLVAKARPNLYSLRFLEAYADSTERKFEEALAKLEQLDTDFGSRLNGLILRGEILQNLKRWDDARMTFESALEIDSEKPAAYLGLARTALALRDYEAAREYARISIGLLFFQPRAHYLHGMALYRLGQFEDAEYAFRISVTQAPLLAAGYRMLGEIARRHTGNPGAQAYYHEQVKIARRRREELKKEKKSGLKFDPDRPPPDEAAPLPELEPRPHLFAGVSPDRIITVVSGLPRSGTSLMMQILEAAGMEMFTDGEREADESNQRGYYEHEKVATLMSREGKAWIAEARGKAVKVVAPLLGKLPRRITGANQENSNPKQAAPLFYRVLYMERDIDEVLTSQSAFLHRVGKSTPAEGTDGEIRDVAKAYRQQERNARAWCGMPHVQAMPVSYSTLVHEPEALLREVAEFIGAPESIDAMRICIDPSLHRVRKGEASD